jgi:hypothetical protein
LNLKIEIITKICELSFENLQKTLSNIALESNPQIRLSKIYDFISLLTVIYSLFFNYPNISYEYIYSNNCLNLLIESTNIFKSLKILSNYLTKIIILGLCALLNNQNITLPSIEIQSSFLNTLLVLLNNQKLNESKKLKELHKDELEIDENDFDENEDESEEEEIFDEENFIKKTVKKLSKEKKIFKEENKFDVIFNNLLFNINIFDISLVRI